MMPAGKYFVGDLCYVFSDTEWDEVCGIIIQGNNVIDGEFNLSDGRRFAMHSTAYGDGVYGDETGHNCYPVDSGSIGCILVDSIKNQNDVYKKELGAVIDFPNPFETGGENKTGIIFFGSTRIMTGEEEEDGDEDYYPIYGEDEDE